jgi:hypothetical protein
MTRGRHIIWVSGQRDTAINASPAAQPDRDGTPSALVAQAALAQFPIDALALMALDAWLTSLALFWYWHRLMLQPPERLDHIAGNASIAWVCLMALEGRVFAFAPLPLVNEPLPLLSHFGPKRFEAWIGCWPSFLKAARRKLLIFS